MHGKTSQVEHDSQGVFTNVINPFEAGRYHSLAVVESTLPAELTLTARTDDGVVMGLRHKEYPLEGVQFHPESILTPDGRCSWRIIFVWRRIRRQGGVRASSKW